MKKQRHHYVWQKYLAPWTTGGQVFCLRSERIFSVGTKNIAVETGFYKIKRLSDDELHFVRALAESSPSEMAKRTNHKWIDNHTAIYEFQDSANAKGVSSLELEELIEINAFNLEEDMQTRIENTGAQHLESMLNDDLSFYSDNDSCIEFLFFLATQFVRTKKMRDIIQGAGVEIGISDMRNCWPVVSHIFATNFGWTMYAERDNYKLRILKNSSELNLISGDQPVINVHPSGSDAESEICLYYPLSPKKAILYSPTSYSGPEIELDLSDCMLSDFNRRIYDASHEQIYAAQESDMQRFL